MKLLLLAFEDTADKAAAIDALVEASEDGAIDGAFATFNLDAADLKDGKLADWVITHFGDA